MIEKRTFSKTQKIEADALISPNKMEVLPGPLPDGRRSGGDEGLGSRLTKMGLVRITSLSPVSMDLRTRRPAGWHAKN